MFSKICEFVFGIVIASLGLSGWVAIIHNNAQGGLAFIVCISCIFMLVAGIIIVADACGLVEG